MSLRVALAVLPFAVATACAPAATTRVLTPAALAADSTIRAALVAEASLDPATFPATSVGVLPLAVHSPDPALAPLGYGLAELVMTDLARSSQVVVVDRLRVQSLLRELALVETGVADPETGPRLGRILGARHLVVGSVDGEAAADIRVDARLARTTDATVSPVVSGLMSLDEVMDAQKELVFRVFDALGVALTPAERAAIEQRPTRNLGALLAYSRGVQAEARLRLDDAVREYREAARLDRAFFAPRDRLRQLELQFPDTYRVGTLALDALNRPRFPEVSDVADPAFHGRQGATLVIPVTIR